MNKRILITGANGFIGSTLVKDLSGTIWEIIPLVRRSRGFKNEVIIDFCDPAFLKVINSLPKVDVVIHLGARIGWDGSSRENLFVSNVLATAELVNWTNKINAFFVFASVAIVCGVKSTYIVSNSQPNLDTDYGYSKWLCEEIIRMSGARHVILRISGVFGINGPSHLGINKAIDRVLKGMSPIQYGSGGIRRNYIYIKDLSSVIKFCIDNGIEGTHLVAGSSINTISEMLQIICNVLLPDSKLEYCEGNNGYDQIVEHSTCLPKGRTFPEAIEDIKNDWYTERASL